MTKKLPLSLLTILALVGMASCGGESTTGSTTGTSDSTSTSSDTSSSSGGDSSSSLPDNFKTNDDFERATNQYEKNGKTYNLTRNTLYTNAGSPHLDSMEEQHVLVVPFGFNNPNYDETPERLEKIKRTFFGTDEELAEVGAWKSVAGYYNTSSYGRGNFTGEVANAWCMWDGSESSAANGITCAEYAANWYKEEYAKENHGDLGADAKPISYFDNNGDGYIDLMWIVYSHPTGTVNDWWAYVTYTNNTAGTKNNPKVKTLGWASIDWMDTAYNGHDPHTFIHETGHTFGLDDYYDYSNSWSPMGGVDMMDHNLGDHSAYSKFTLGWVNPWIVNDDAIITLRSTTLTGDCFVLGPSDYNGTAFDEYLMIEFITPEGLNEKDYKSGYQGTTGFSEPGIRVTHADARVYNNESTRDGYLSENPWDGYDLRIANTRGGRMGIKSDGDYWPSAQGSTAGKYMANLTIIESSFDKSNNPLTKYGYNASNSSLFKKGERLNFSVGGWSEVFMPSETNLWNKAKTITGWEGNAQTFTVDSSMTIDYKLSIMSIKQVEGEWVAQVKVEKTK